MQFIAAPRQQNSWLAFLRSRNTRHLCMAQYFPIDKCLLAVLTFWTEILSTYFFPLEEGKLIGCLPWLYRLLE